MVKDLYSTPVYTGWNRNRTQDYPDRFGSDPLQMGSYIAECIEPFNKNLFMMKCYDSNAFLLFPPKPCIVIRDDDTMERRCTLFNCRLFPGHVCLLIAL